MSTHTEDTKDIWLDECFAAARQDTTAAPDDLITKILADAGTMQQEFATQSLVATPVRAGLFARVSQALGGWPSITGLATASLAGVWIGMSAPAGLEGVTQALVGAEAVIDVVDQYYQAEFELAGDL
ncbi:hypothetical protein ROA7450_00829 [Roseovarius albus]|uniref:Uncharacterized protein n=1 Tax=Roseovarius albus TaxID=1247867 RepID=A0A1X6YIS7_9RHOB|nr:hypothetical protein [Roseovarius albus]SLN22342.1 hypothetical protein ROA7450_00829 [Roseovarius albus]